MYVQDNIVSTDLEIIKNNILFLINKYQELPNMFFLNTFPNLFNKKVKENE